jgi:large subunit ribosomal protein L25
MPEAVQLEASPREAFGKHVRQLRREGQTPAIVYGHGIETYPIAIDTRTLLATLPRVGKTTLIALAVPGRPRRNVLVRKVQRDPVTQAVQHVDFLAVRMDETLRQEVPISLVGEAPAAQRSDIVLLQGTRTLTVESLPGDLPQSIAVDISTLVEDNQSIFAGDINLPPNVTLVTPAEEMVVKVQPPKIAVEEEVAAPPEEAEVAPEAIAAEAGEPTESEDVPATEQET